MGKNWCTAAPYRIHAVDRSMPETSLLRRGIVPVQWELYPFWGQEPTAALVLMDGLVRFPVPHSTEQANAFLEKMGSGFQPSAFKVTPHPSDTWDRGPCAACFSWEDTLQPCACGQVAYCNAEHAAAHFELHKMVCTAKGMT